MVAVGGFTAIPKAVESQFKSMKIEAILTMRQFVLAYVRT